MNADHCTDEQSDSGAAPRQSEKASPAASQTESPRLGIIHLLAWTACVAAYYGTQRSLALLAGFEPSTTLRLSPRLLEGCLWGICDGAALCGLVLLVARRLRGLRFPRYPGEILFIILGLIVVIELADRCLRVFTQLTYQTRPVYTFLTEALFALIFLAAIIRTKSLRWRICFGSYLVALAPPIAGEATKLVLLFDAPRVFVNQAVWIMATIGSVCLVVAAAKDFLDRHRMRYPWTHWTGVVLALLKLAEVRYVFLQPLLRWLSSVYF